MFQCAQSTATVVGLGATGLSLARFLSRRGAVVTAVDSEESPAALVQYRSEFPAAKFVTMDFARDRLPASDLIALSPGVPRASFTVRSAIEAGTPVVGDIELFAREVPDGARVFAVTGSNGKTTTTALSGELARTVDGGARVAGNIGIPILDALAEAPDCRTWVLELSSFQLESTVSLKTEAAAVINVTPNHLDRYPSFFAYAACKERIFGGAERQVINRDDVWSASMRRTEVAATTFGAGRPLTKQDYGLDIAGPEGQLLRGSQSIIAMAELGIPGAHNAQNALAAMALMDSLAVTRPDCQRVLRSFRGMPHRCQAVGEIDGVRVIDDSKATTIVATVAALDGLATPTWLIAGGDGKGQDFGELVPAAARHCRAVHLIGKDADAIAAALSASGVSWQKFASLDDAVAAALDGARAGEQLLLSPACASWDMFRNFGHRAEVFVRAVSDWAASRGRVLTSPTSPKRGTAS